MSHDQVEDISIDFSIISLHRARKNAANGSQDQLLLIRKSKVCDKLLHMSASQNLETKYLWAAACKSEVLMRRFDPDKHFTCN